MWIDIVFLAVLLYGFWQGWNQGIIGTLMTLAIYAFGIVMAFKMASVTAIVLERLFSSDHPLMFVAGFAVNMLIIYLVVSLATNNIEHMLTRAYLGVFNRMVGGVAIGGFYVLLFSVIIWFLTQANGISTDTLSKSTTYPLLKEMPKSAKGIAVRFQPLVSDSWDDFNKWMDKAKNYGMEKTEEKARLYDVPGSDKRFDAAPQKSPGRKPTQDSNPIEE